MTPLPEPAITIVYVCTVTGEVKVATNVSPDAKVLVTNSWREFDTLRQGIPYLVKPTRDPL